METSIPAVVAHAVAEGIESGKVPGVVVAVAYGERPAAFLSVGSDADGQALSQESLFPVASITKLATALALLRLADDGLLALDDLLWDYLPDADGAQADVTLRALLCHTSGMPLDILKEAAPYGQGLDWPTLARACTLTPLEAAPGTRVQYSNAGYGLLALVAERITGQPFAEALQALVLGPLGIEGYLGVEPPRQPARLANVRSSHVGTAFEPYNTPFWRGMALPWGGMLTTAAGALALVQAFQGRPGGFLRHETQAAAIQDHTGGLNGGMIAPLLWSPCPWALGPELRGNKQPHWAPAQASSGSFGHSGASGCLAWADPQADTAWALLGSRTADSGWLLRRGAAIGAAILAGRPT